MAVSGVSFGFFAALSILYAFIMFPLAQCQFPASAPSPTSDGTTIDQGIAYVLMLLALVLTYLIHLIH
ncbi:hypothetical protein JCGZ_26007 [Jatropha curcas]|uniref:Uncharacterized protein n=1 Tax=Jatropha curcas TaxID=180498 RepID=A0A067JE86_JATCU|nr:arabinogalactan protein 41 [Jatropha curcas]KDP22176.1 hypothetical protein JCGZ_26007 [Jatropha curcas]